jgi:hypothetical protein
MCARATPSWCGSSTGWAAICSTSEALEACHLYSYAEIGRHDIEGGLLLRRDLHRLFDQGLLYAALQGQPLHVRLTAQQHDWLALHWAEWRSPAINA